MCKKILILILLAMANTAIFAKDDIIYVINPDTSKYVFDYGAATHRPNCHETIGNIEIYGWIHHSGGKEVGVAVRDKTTQIRQLLVQVINEQPWIVCYPDNCSKDDLPSPRGLATYSWRSLPGSQIYKVLLPGCTETN